MEIICQNKLVAIDLEEHRGSPNVSTNLLKVLEKIHIKSSLPKVPYLNIDIIKKYGNLVIKTADGLELKINSLILVSVSPMFNDFLKEINDVQDLVILSEFDSSDLKMFREFIMEGYLPKNPKSSKTEN